MIGTTVQFLAGPTLHGDACRACYTWVSDAGDALGRFNPGRLFDHGLSVSEDEARVAVLYTKACET